MLSKNQKKATCLKVFEDCKISILINLVRPINNTAPNLTVTLMRLLPKKGLVTMKRQGTLDQTLHSVMLHFRVMRLLDISAINNNK